VLGQQNPISAGAQTSGFSEKNVPDRVIRRVINSRMVNSHPGKNLPGSLILHITNLDVRTYATSTYWFGSKLPPCSMAFEQHLSKAVATSSFSERGRSDIFLEKLHQPISSLLVAAGDDANHSGVADKSSMPSSQRGSVAAHRTNLGE